MAVKEGTTVEQEEENRHYESATATKETLLPMSVYAASTAKEEEK